MRASGGRSGATRLFVLFAVASLVPTLVLVVVLGGSLRRDALSRTLSDGRAQAQLIAQTLIAPTLADDGLERGLDLASATDVSSAVVAATAAGSVVRVHLHALSGQLVYPVDVAPGRQATGRDVSPAELSRAIGGQTMASVRTIGATPRSTGGDVIRVLTPVLEPTDDRLVGVLEVWLPYDAVARSVTAQSQRLTVLLTSGLVAQYLVVAAISWLVTRRLRRQSTMYEHLANHDPLTELPNRKLFRSQLAECVDQARRSGGACSVAIVDLDRFKEVNDSLGHHVGDELLRQVSARMQQSLRTDDRVARLGGDEFGIMLPGTDDRAAVRVLTAVREAIAADLDLAGLRVSVGSSIGVASFPLHGANVDVLLQHADLAMYAAKSGQRGVMGFDPLATPVRPDRLAIGSDLRRGIAAGELVLHYQPQLRLGADGVDRVETVEALVRWQHPERGLLYPDAFIEVAEQNDLVDVLTQVVLRDALAQLNRWQAQGHVLRVAVNISAHTMHDRTLPRTVAEHLRNAGLPASRLILELTETALVADPVAVRAVVAELGGMGLALSLDDFGQGYTSLAYLRGLALSELKIDKAFVMRMTASAQDEAIVRSVVGLAHSLELALVAEGVEDADVLASLRQMGCDTAQGYHISRPVPGDQLAAWLGRRSPSAPVADALVVR